MKSKLAILTACLIAVVFLAGCEGVGGSAGLFGIGGGSSDGGESVVAALSGGGDSGLGGGSGSGNPGGSGSGNPGGGVHNPEPATVALLGSGLFAYALLRRKKKR